MGSTYSKGTVTKNSSQGCLGRAPWATPALAVVRAVLLEGGLELLNESALLLVELGRGLNVNGHDLFAALLRLDVRHTQPPEPEFVPVLRPRRHP